MRCGSGRRAMASNAKSFTMSPKYDGSSRPSRFSVGDERGLANCPAIRPTFTVGTPVLYVNTTDICRITLSLSRMLSAVNSANDSAQSPALRRKPSPTLTAASDSRSERASPANTSGGMRRSSSVTSSSSAVSGHSGWCAAARRRQLAGSQSKLPRGTGAVMNRSRHREITGSEVRAGGALAGAAHLERTSVAHLLELALRLDLLREQRCLDAVEEPFEPADQLRLRDAQLRITRRGARERQRHVRELLAEVGREDLLELVDGALVDLLERTASGVVE